MTKLTKTSMDFYEDTFNPSKCADLQLAPAEETIIHKLPSPAKSVRKLPFIPKLDLSKAPAYEDSETSEVYKVVQKERTGDSSDETSNLMQTSPSEGSSMLEFISIEQRCTEMNL